MLLINVQEASKNKKFSNNIMSNSTCNCGAVDIVTIAVLEHV